MLYANTHPLLSSIIPAQLADPASDWCHVVLCRIEIMPMTPSVCFQMSGSHIIYRTADAHSAFSWARCGMLCWPHARILCVYVCVYNVCVCMCFKTFMCVCVCVCVCLGGGGGGRDSLGESALGEGSCLQMLACITGPGMSGVPDPHPNELAT